MKTLIISLLLAAASFASKAQIKAPYFNSAAQHIVIYSDSSLTGKQAYLSAKNWLMSQRLLPLTDIENSRMYFKVEHTIKRETVRNEDITVKMYVDLTFKEGKYRVIVQPYWASHRLVTTNEDIDTYKLIAQYNHPEHEGFYRKAFLENYTLDLIKTCEAVMSAVLKGINSKDNF